MKECVFCSIVKGEAPCHKVWEDAEHLAFLSIEPNTEGFTVVVTKRHYPSYAFAGSDRVLAKLVLASKRVGRLLDRRLDDVGRTGLILEGFGVDHLHAKLVPMHGTKLKRWKPILSKNGRYFTRYEGYISSHSVHSRRADGKRLAALARKIRGKN